MSSVSPADWCGQYWGTDIILGTFWQMGNAARRLETDKRAIPRQGIENRCQLNNENVFGYNAIDCVRGEFDIVTWNRYYCYNKVMLLITLITYHL